MFASHMGKDAGEFAFPQFSRGKNQVKRKALLICITVCLEIQEARAKLATVSKRARSKGGMSTPRY